MKNDLTKREFEVLKLVAVNASNTEIAKILTISIHTVKTHISSIISKLKANGRTHAIVKAIKYSILNLDKDIDVEYSKNPEKSMI